jgi:long-chain acyl-CoA synthetase
MPSSSEPYLAFEDDLAAAGAGMSLSFRAALHPERAAILCEHGDRSFAELNARSNQLVRALRGLGLAAGDGVAIVSHNRPEFAELQFACLRGGFRLTPVNWHGTPDEIAYIVEDCEARGLVVDANLPEAAARALERARSRLVARLAVGGALAGFESYQDALAGADAHDIDDPQLGDVMLYTSGTTGRPKGVRRPPPDPKTAGLGLRAMTAVFGYRADEGDVSLATGPLYHSGPLNICMQWPISSGVPVVLMDRWSAAGMLEQIERHRVTHTFCVPTMFHRLLALPDEVRSRRDVSSLRFIIHGAAPTPVEVKRRIIEWFGPIVTEIFAATEGPGTFVSSEEWLKRPGTVGRPNPDDVRIVGDDGTPMPDGEPGTLYLRSAAGSRFEYFRAPGKTREAFDGDFFTVGDIGYLDEAGYLFLTGRSAELILIGGTNVYPAEIDDTLLLHPDVHDAAAIGVPNEEWGEEVKAVVSLVEGVEPTPELAEAILAYARERLPSIKAPRSVDFVEDVPRSEAGKVYRKRLRDRYPSA